MSGYYLEEVSNRNHTKLIQKMRVYRGVGYCHQWVHPGNAKWPERQIAVQISPIKMCLKKWMQFARRHFVGGPLIARPDTKLHHSKSDCSSQVASKSTFVKSSKSTHTISPRIPTNTTAQEQKLPLSIARATAPSDSLFFRPLKRRDYRSIFNLPETMMRDTTTQQS